METLNTFYIDGAWVAPSPGATTADIVNPATEQVIGTLAMGTADDVERAVAAARRAFPAWSQTSREARLALLSRIVELYQARMGDIAAAVTAEIGAPLWLSQQRQAPAGLVQLQATIAALKDLQFQTTRGTTQIVREAVGVVALVTPWNWPLNQIAAKVAPALAAGCTVVLKPSEISPLDARIFAEILHEAGVPAGVFNMLYGDGQLVGRALSSHPQVDMVSITGSTRAGVDVAVHAAPTVKRVTQELGGKSANLILDDADLKAAIPASVIACMMNSGQTCAAPTRLLVPRSRYDEAVAIAAATADKLAVGDPLHPDSKLGPISNRAQYARVQAMIATGIEEGARLAAGGLGRPAGLEQGFYARPTVFADVHGDMAIARQEVFGPVLAMIPYDTEAEAIDIANDSVYGLAGYVWSADAERARVVAGQLRVGLVQINGAPMDFSAPFGGYKASGNGREFGEYGLSEFLEYKSVVGCQD
ncbi:aldehyde dehydrogenase family protein [Cupriavidus numazuensis]|uniref:3-succinoylsemialdehyde-pyridine dehydrogenase n=1 Tax=Cupriavidus numazuensis TaxID=221992 RepID=A0ABN7QBT3_9BURK|nr:aldehyde dehydrogenase family protein [Cupriavidus numazuensis]CAG2156451.1 3-succinoylsemialdehyde-pyridine dehydrogenase [Cupriavidus numazuensis]